jgi:ATP-dependent RNA helicase RhlE
VDGVKILEIFGGINERAQMDMLRLGVDVLVATPGRLLKLLKMGIPTTKFIVTRYQDPSPIDLSKVQTFVVDECDRMLNLGFAPDVFEVREFLPHGNK